MNRVIIYAPKSIGQFYKAISWLICVSINRATIQSIEVKLVPPLWSLQNVIRELNLSSYQSS